MDLIEPDWGELRSAYDHIINVSGDTLPDDDLTESIAGLRWAPGAEEGCALHSFGWNKQGDVDSICRALRKVISRPDKTRFESLYSLLGQKPALSYVDELWNRLNAERAELDSVRLRELALFLCKRAPHREPVKYGLTLLGFSGSEEDLDVVRTLGQSEELALHAALAAIRLSRDPETTIWQMAKRLTGWGRIHIVERLAETCRRDIQEWMLREGFKNDVMVEYLACICARAGRLHEALRPEIVDKALLDDAGELIRGMTQDEPFQSLADYEHAAEAVEHYVKHVRSIEEVGLDHYLALADLRCYLVAPPKRDQKMILWDEARRTALVGAIENLLNRVAWRERVARGLASQDEQEFWTADQVAKLIGIDTWVLIFERVKASPTESNGWFRLLEQSDANRIEEVLRVAERILPLRSLATGPPAEAAMAPSNGPDWTLGYILQALRRFPGRGWPFIQSAILSASEANRNWALHVLTEWPRDSWPDGALDLIHSVKDSQPSQDLKEPFERLLVGLPTVPTPNEPDPGPEQVPD